MKQNERAVGINPMKPINKVIILGSVILSVLITTGCGHHTRTRISTSSPERQLVATFDEHATFKDGGDRAIITFDGHELEVQKQWLLLDAGKLKAGIPSGTKKVEIQVRHGILSMSADGHNVIKTPI